MIIYKIHKADQIFHRSFSILDGLEKQKSILADIKVYIMFGLIGDI